MTIKYTNMGLLSYVFLFYDKKIRKEVIQPHVPVRLPCYDLAPITSFTFGLST